MNACGGGRASRGPVGSIAGYVDDHGQPERRRSAKVHLMPDELSAEFESYRKTLRTEDEKLAFDRMIKQLLQARGVDYVRGYVDGLKEGLR